MKYCYIHGFNSGLNTPTLGALEQALGKEVVGLSYDSSASYYINMKDLSLQLLNIEDDCIIIGTSLGGFYANRMLLNKNAAGAVMFNPCNFPGESLKKFIGMNTNFATGETYELTEETVRSYSIATEVDIRHIMKPKIVYLADNDVLINNHESEIYWKGCAQVEWFEGEHRVSDFRPFRDEILSMENLLFI